MFVKTEQNTPHCHRLQMSLLLWRCCDIQFIFFDHMPLSAQQSSNFCKNLSLIFTKILSCLFSAHCTETTNFIENKEICLLQIVYYVYYQGFLIRMSRITFSTARNHTLLHRKRTEIK